MDENSFTIGAIFIPKIKNRIANMRDGLKIVMSIPRIGFTSAATILAEVGDFNGFDKAEQLAACTSYSLCYILKLFYNFKKKLEK